jgi:hypothetical protein
MKNTHRMIQAVQWFARIEPPLAGLVFVACSIAARNSEAEPFEVGGLAMLIVLQIFLFPYLALVYWIIPELFHSGRNRSETDKVSWFFFAGLTLGIGPMAVYWMKVDSQLTSFISTRSEDSRVKNPSSCPNEHEGSSANPETE